MFKVDYENNMGGCSTTAFHLPGETGLHGSCGHGGTHWSVSPKKERAWGEGNGIQGVKESQERTKQMRRAIKGENGRSHYRDRLLLHCLRSFPDHECHHSLSPQMV